MELQNLKLPKFSVLIKPIEQLRSLNNLHDPIKHVCKLYFCSIIQQKSNARRFLHSWAFKWYEAGYAEKSFTVLYGSPNPVNTAYVPYVCLCHILHQRQKLWSKIPDIFRQKYKIQRHFYTLTGNYRYNRFSRKKTVLLSKKTSKNSLEISKFC